jgi:fibronectin-binding autotransporter adhesin
MGVGVYLRPGGHVRLRRAVGLFILVCGFSGIRAYGQVVATWTGSSGNWSNSSNWSTLSVPNDGGGTFYSAVINGTGSDTVTFGANGTQINSISLGTGETLQDNGLAPALTIGDPGFPSAGSLTNSGTINWGNGSNLTLDITAGNGSITNSGTINLTNSTLTTNDSGNGNAAVLTGGGTINLLAGTIVGASGTETLQNNDNTIQGSGTISNLNLINNGTIDANGSSPLTLASNTVNNGTVNVTGTGGLNLTGKFIDNGTVDINHSSLAGSFNFNPGYTSYGGAGNLIVENGSTASLAVLGTFNGGPGGGNTKTLVESGSTLTAGTIYNYHGSLDVLGGSVVTSGGIDNTSGSVLIDHSTLNLGSSGIGLGPVGSRVTVQNGGTLNLADFDPILNTTNITGSSVMNVSGNLGNPGNPDAYNVITVDNSVLKVGGDVFSADKITLQNNSIGVVTGSVNLYLSTMTIDHSQLSVGGNLISGFGGLAIDNSAIVNVLGAVTNNGYGITFGGTGDLLNVQGSFANTTNLSIGSLDTVNANGGLANSSGTVSISSGGTLNASNYSQTSGSTDVSGRLTSQSYSQSGGNTTVETGGVLSATTFTATGGTVTVNGILDPTAVEIDSGASLQGTGTIIGNVTMGGMLTPGGPGAPGTITVFGDYDQTNTGILDELISPLAQSFLDVNGDVTLNAGSFLNIILLEGYDPLGQTLDIMDYYSLVGQFSNGSSFWQDGYLWDISYGQHELDATAVQTPEPSALLLLLIGFAALSPWIFRRSAKHQHLA